MSSMPLSPQELQYHIVAVCFEANMIFTMKNLDRVLYVNGPRNTLSVFNENMRSHTETMIFNLSGHRIPMFAINSNIEKQLLHELLEHLNKGNPPNTFTYMITLEFLMVNGYNKARTFLFDVVLSFTKTDSCLLKVGVVFSLSTEFNPMHVKLIAQGQLQLLGKEDMDLGTGIKDMDFCQPSTEEVVEVPRIPPSTASVQEVVLAAAQIPPSILTPPILFVIGCLTTILLALILR